MADSNSKDAAYSVSVKEEVDAKVHTEKSTCHHHHIHSRETHGVNNCIDENTSLDDVKAPNVFERAKEEFQALAQLFHQKKEAHAHDTGDGNQIAESKFKHEIPNSPSAEKKAKSSSANLIARTKKEIKGIIHNNKSKHHPHHKETHGRNDDIDENTPANEVKGPNVFGRVKEEFEAVLQAILPKKGS
ncbi:hypothetical protein HN51_011934 [Arachis hypogaea]|uniref:Uncharacterized protein LOC107478840 isoform X1 n=1 Tax=Arachis duranensis TaxID=130453 RepID=A0A6P4CPX2_ARADU|nr:uncharacterized protein LOC107478840 isoform X1 [Arachis duranensis]XP_025688505.1 uncharacterized protein LOC112790361 isoform X1 [Arachis hypogaea]QHO57327.1 uncharacterized protein DS421_3g81340 [Arachis hypogaea]